MPLRQRHRGSHSAPASRGILLIVLATAAYGVHPSLTQLAYADGLSPAFMSMANCAVRAVAFCMACRMVGAPILPKPFDLRSFAGGGFFTALSLICNISAFFYLPGAVVVTIALTCSIMLMVFLSLRGELKLNATMLLSMLSAFLGVALVVGLFDSHTAELSVIGVLLSLGAAAATAVRLYVFEGQTKTVSPVAVGARAFLSALPFVFVFSLFQRISPPETAYGWGCVAIACASSITGAVLTLYAIPRIGSFQVSLWSKLEPIFTAGVAAAVLHERLASIQFAGMALVIVSLVIYQTVGAATRRERLIAAQPEQTLQP